MDNLDTVLHSELKSDQDFNPLCDAGYREDDWTKICGYALDILYKVPVETKPKTEQQLFNIQLSFYEKNGCKHELQNLYSLMFSYTQSLILRFKKNGRYIDRDKLEDMSHEVCLKVISQFIDRPGFLIEGSFAGYIKWKILEVTGEADDFEKAKQLDPKTKTYKKIPLISLNSVLDSTRLQESSLESLQEKLHFKFLGSGYGSEEDKSFLDIRSKEVVEGVLKVIKVLREYISYSANDDLEYYTWDFYTATSLYVLFKHGLKEYHTWMSYAPDATIRNLLECTLMEICAFLNDTEETSLH